MRAMRAALWAFFVAMALVACGGGGDGGGGGAALVFTPASVSVNVASGDSATVSVRATVRDPAIFAGDVYVYIVDTERVLTDSFELAQVNASTFSATVHTAPNLAVRRYQGTFQVQLCRDISCAAQYPGSPVPLPYDITVTPAPLRAAAASTTAGSVHRGGSIASPVSVAVTGPELAWTATTPAPWLQISAGTGTGPGSFNVAYVTPTLAEGTYSSTVTVRASDGQTVVVPFTLEVLPTAFMLTSGVPTFAAVNGAPIPAQTLSFALDNGVPSPWSATESAPWMRVSSLAGMTPAVLTLQPDPTVGPLASGAHSADLVLSSAGIPNRTVNTQLTLSRPTLSAPAVALTLGGSKGRDLGAAQTVPVSLNTGTNSWPYALSGLPAWLSSSTATGRVSQSGTTISVTPNVAGVTPGSTSATVTMTATVNGDAAVLPFTVNLNADQRRLLASEWGVGLASTPTGTVASRTLTVSDNFAGTLAWAAVSDAAWLSVTASGSTTGSNSLTLSANASALPAGVVSYASVTVSTATSGVEPAVIRVALWKSASGLAAITTLPLTYTNLVADKIRPYVYANNGGTSIDVFNAYTTERVTTIAGVGAALGQMTVSPDGSRLYALDTAARSMAVVNLTDMTRAAVWSIDNLVDGYTSVLAIRPNGVEIVLVGDGTAYTAGRSLGATRMLGPLAATADGRTVYTLGVKHGVDYSAMSGGVLFANVLGLTNGNSRGNLRAVAVSPDGSRVYEASGGGVSVGDRGFYQCAAIDGLSGNFIAPLPGGDAYPNSVAVTSDGRAICGIDGASAASDFWVHSSSGAMLQGYKIAGYGARLKERQMVVTPDGVVVVALTTDPRIAFVPIGR